MGIDPLSNRTYDLIRPGALERRPVGPHQAQRPRCGCREVPAMSDSRPTIEESILVVVKAVAARRARHRADPAQVGLTAGAIAERVTGITLPPRSGRDGWWLVGRVLDEIADAEFSVWYMPGPRRIGLSRRDRPAAVSPTPPVDRPYYYDGLRRKWIDAATGAVIADPSTTGASGPGHETGPRAAT